MLASNLEELHRLTGIVNDTVPVPGGSGWGARRAPWRALHQWLLTYWTTTRPHCPRQVTF